MRTRQLKFRIGSFYEFCAHRVLFYAGSFGNDAMFEASLEDFRKFRALLRSEEKQTEFLKRKIGTIVPVYNYTSIGQKVFEDHGELRGGLVCVGQGKFLCDIEFDDGVYSRFVNVFDLPH